MRKRHLTSIGNKAKALTLLLLMLTAADSLCAQDMFTIDGFVVDSRTRNYLPGATVELLSAKDSSVIKQVKAARYGMWSSTRGSYDDSYYQFSVPREASEYIIRASFLGYQTECVNVSLSNLKRREYSRTMPDICLRPESKVLDEVNVVGTKVKFYYKGDTVVYNADAFVLADGSMLDGLVRQLPGVEIREDGNIYHDGKLVENLLLNGKEFFGNNKQVMLDMLPAFTVRNVKVYDKYGDRSELVGDKIANDKLYVMDVILKKEYSIGWMGNIEGGGGTSDRYLGRLFAMRFTDHSRIGVYGVINNLNDKRKPGMDSDWSPDKLSPGDSREILGGLDYYIDDRLGRFRLNGNVQAAHTDQDLTENTDKVNFLPAGDTYEYVRSVNRNKMFTLNTQHNMYFKFDKADFAIRPKFNYADYDNRQTSLDGIFSEMQTGMSRDILDNLYSPTVSDDIRRAAVYRYKTERLSKGHALGGSLDIGSNIKLNDFGDYLTLAATGTGESRHDDTFNRYGVNYGADGEAGPAGYQYFKNHPDDKAGFTVGAVYNYKASKEWNLNFTGRVEYEHADRHSSLFLLDRIEGTADGQLGTLPSVAEYERTIDPRNSYVAKTYDCSYAFSPNVTWEHWSGNGIHWFWNAYVDIQPMRKKLTYHRGEINTTIVKKSFHVQLPFFNFNVENKDRSFGMNVRAEIQSTIPDLVNMVDMTDDTDPMNVTIGNPELDDQTRYYVRFLFNRNRPGKQLRHSWSLEYTYRRNAVSIGYTYNPDNGVRTYRADNVNGNWDFNGYYGIYAPLDKAKKLTLDAKTSIRFNNSVDLLGVSTTDAFTAARSTVKTTTLKEDLSLDYKIGNSQIGLKGSYAWRNVNGDTEGFQDFDAMDFNYGATAIINLPWNMQLSTDLMMYSRRGYEGSSLNTDDLVWNARLSYTTLKGRLTFMLDAFDILNQINNVTRVVNAQGRTETFTNALPRYALLHVAYKFNIAPKNKK